MNAIHKLLKKIGFVVKKTLRASEQEGLDIAQTRGVWAEFQKTLDPNRLIFLDESGGKTNIMVMGLTFYIIDKLGIANDKNEPDKID